MTEKEQIINFWADPEKAYLMEKIRLTHGWTKPHMRWHVKNIRMKLKAMGDERWRGMYRQIQKKSLVLHCQEEVIKNYGVVHAPDIDADKDPRPIWLCIDSNRYKKQIAAMHRPEGNAR